MLALGLLMAGCAPTRGAGAGPVTGPARTAVVEVSNDNWADVTVYAVQSGLRQRLGSVSSMSRRAFLLPAGITAGRGELRLLIDLIGSRETHLTEPFMINPGDRAVLRVQNHLAISSVSVWQR